VGGPGAQLERPHEHGLSFRRSHPPPRHFALASSQFARSTITWATAADLIKPPASTARNAGLAGHGGVHQARTDGPDADSSARDFICQRVRAVQEGTSASRIIERLVKEYLSKKEGK
jgi:hypothetical protein